MVEVPSSLASIDAAWMTQALREAGHDAPDVTQLTYEPLKGIVGALGEVGVFRLTYADHTTLPAALLGKCPLDDDIARMYNSVMRYYRRETGFYRDLAGDVPMRVPRCWASLSDGEQHLLLLEYLEDATPGDVLAGTSWDKMRRLITDMATLHGQFWMNAKVRELPWMFQFTEPSLQMGFDMVKVTWPMAKAERPGLVPDDLAALIEGPYLEDRTPQQWIDAYDARPWTLVHGDYELENILFVDDEPVVVDWQGIMVGFPAMDLGFTLAISGTDESRAREGELLDHYRAVLADSGGPQWSHSELMDDLAWSMLFFVAGQSIPFVQDYDAMGETGVRIRQRMVAAWTDCVAAAIRWETAQRVVVPG